MTFKMKGSPMKRNFDVGSSPVKHKMEVEKGGHVIGGGGTVPEVTAEQAKAHDDKYGEGHSDPHRIKAVSTAVGKGVAGAGAKLLEKKRLSKTASRGVIKAAEKTERGKKSPLEHSNPYATGHGNEFADMITEEEYNDKHPGPGTSSTRGYHYGHKGNSPIDPPSKAWKAIASQVKVAAKQLKKKKKTK